MAVSGRNGGQVIVGFGAEGEEAIEKQFSREDARRLGHLDRSRVQQGVRIHEDSAVCRIERGRRPIVKTARGQVTCGFMVLAGNVCLGESGGEAPPEISLRILPVAPTWSRRRR